MHTTGGYALFAAFTTATTFHLNKDDIFACVADCGWITGHTYVVYGALLNGGTTFVFESTPMYPDAGRCVIAYSPSWLVHLPRLDSSLVSIGGLSYYFLLFVVTTLISFFFFFSVYRMGWPSPMEGTGI